MCSFKKPAAGSLSLCEVVLGLVVTAFLSSNGVLGQLGREFSLNSTAQYAGGTTAVLCRSGADLVAAFANTSVLFAYLAANINITDEDWASYATPIMLWRNMTVSGLYPDADTWPLLDLGFTLNRVRLGSGVTLQFSQLAMLNWRRGAYFQASGVDLVATNPDIGAGTDAVPGLVMLKEMVLIQRTCLPNLLSSASVGSLLRPPQLPGEQLTSRLPQIANCSNDASAPAVARCWAAVGIYMDMATAGVNFNELHNAVIAGYNFWLLNVHYKCATVMQEACAKELTVIGCYYHMFPRDLPALVGPYAVPPAQQQQKSRNAPGAAGDSGGGDGSSLLAPLLGGLLGGVALLGLVSGLAFLAWRRLRVPSDSPKPSSSLDGVAPNNNNNMPRLGSTNGRHQDPEAVGSGAGGRPGKLTEAAAAAAGGKGLPTFISQKEEGQEVVCVSLCGGPDPDAVGLAHPSSSILTPKTPTLGSGGSSGPAAGGGGGGRRGLTPSSCRSWSETGVQEQSGSLASLAQLRCTSDEVALLPVTPLTPIQPGVNLDARAVSSSVKLLPVSLGKGAFGRVVEGVYGGQRVAVKLLNTGLLNTGVEEASMLIDNAAGAPDATGNEDGPSRMAWRSLVQEVEVLARCQHPHIVKLLAASLVPPRVCLVMELMDTSLDRLLHGVEGGNVLPLQTVLHIAMQVARALSYLHPTVLHRDLKPANVLISQPHSDTPLAKLADFGLSRLQTTVHATKNAEVGTAAYIAPESFDVLCPAMSDRAEIYAFGVILWEMLSGKRPWQGSSTAQIAFAVSMLNSRLPLRGLSAERCPPKLVALIVSCWDPDPMRRPAAAEVVKMLALVQEALASHSTALSPLSSGRGHTLGGSSVKTVRSTDHLPT